MAKTFVPAALAGALGAAVVLDIYTKGAVHKAAFNKAKSAYDLAKTVVSKKSSSNNEERDIYDADYDKANSHCTCGTCEGKTEAEPVYNG